jgi:lysyl-tRNA synthetase class 2
MLEWYRAFCGFERVIEDTEILVAVVAETLSGAGQLRVAGRTVDVTPPFDRVSVRDAFREHANVSDASDLAAQDEARYFQLFVDRVEPGLARLDRPVFLTRFPATQGALARLCSDDHTVVERFELVVGGVEICNGFGELTDAAEQRRRFENELLRRQRKGGREQPIDERLLAALEEGMPPSSGNALGLDRLVALALGVDAISEVLSFPASHP